MSPLALTAYDAGRNVATIALAVVFVLLLLRAFGMLPRKRGAAREGDRPRRGGRARRPATVAFFNGPLMPGTSRRWAPDEGRLRGGLRGLPVRAGRSTRECVFAELHERGAKRHPGRFRDAGGAGPRRPRPATCR